ncbi:hypothetical protein D3C73_770100 [compost metagenome]
MRKKRRSCADGLNPVGVVGRLIHQAIAGLASHTSSKGAASASTWGEESRAANSSSAKAGAIHRLLYMPARSLPLERSTSREGCHCSRRRLLISMRHSERPIASKLSNASEGNQTIDNSARMKCWPEVRNAALRCCPHGISAAF